MQNVLPTADAATRVAIPAHIRNWLIASDMPKDRGFVASIGSVPFRWFSALPAPSLLCPGVVVRCLATGERHLATGGDNKAGSQSLISLF